MATYSENLNGANCHLSGQTMLSLQITEDAGTDFATGTVTSLAPNGAHALGAIVETVEGGVSTGLWVVVKRTVLQSGEKTWRRRDGDANYRHLPYVTYRLRRAGYLECRATISQANVGVDNWPPRFCSYEGYRIKEWGLYQQQLHGEITFWDYMAGLEGLITVGSGAELIQRIAGWFGLTVQFWVNCPILPEEYNPVGSTLLSAVKEIASWSGADVYLGRSGLIVYSFDAVFGQGRALPRPASVAVHEEVEELQGTTLVSVIGEKYSHQMTLEEWGSRGEDGAWIPPTWGFARTAEAVEYSTQIGGVALHVEERLEIKEHSVSDALARRISQQKIGRLILENALHVWRGPAEGSQNVQPLANGVLGVNRTLQWQGAKYRYEIDIRGPQTELGWSADDTGGWW